MASGLFFQNLVRTDRRFARKSNVKKFIWESTERLETSSHKIMKGEKADWV